MAKSAKATFKETLSEFTRIKGEIAARRFSPLYLLMGEESYFIDRLCELLSDGIIDPSMRDFSQLTLYGKDSECGTIINHARQMPMMGNYQVIIVKEAQQLRKIEELALYTATPSPTTVLVLCHKEKSLDKRTQLYKHCSAVGTVFESIRPRDYEIGGWLGDFIRARGLTIEPRALSMLIDHLGTDISKISNELRKLFTRLPEGTRNITADDVEQNIGISKDFNNFELTRAISERNMERAMMIAEHFARNPKENPLVVTMSALFTHFQRIFIVNYQLWLTRQKSQPMTSDYELMAMLKLPAAFFVNEYKTAASQYPNKKVFNILGLLRQYDLKSKGMESGSASDGELLRELLLKIFLAPA